MNRFLLLSVLAVVLAGCATIIEGPTQEVYVETPGSRESLCFLDVGGHRYHVEPPQSVIISKAPGTMDVRCMAEGNRYKALSIPSNLSTAAAGNVMTAFIGTGVDYETGALYEFPSRIIVDFSGVRPRPAPLPPYQQLLLESPELIDMEEFRPGWPALQSDRYDPIPSLQKKDFDGGGDDPFGSYQQSVLPSVSVNSVNNAAPGSASDLTRRMNPTVFGTGGTSNSSAYSGFVGGTSQPQPVWNGR